MKKNLVVMFGGPSVEHDVSIITAMQVIQNADSSAYNVYPLYWAHDGNFYVVQYFEHAKNDLIKNINDALKHPIRVTFDHKVFCVNVHGSLLSRGRSYRPDVIIPCFHGTSGEDGAVQGLLEVIDVAYSGSGVTASAVGMDKALFKSVMKEHGLPVLDYKTIYKKDLGIIDQLKLFPYPLIAKPAHLGSSIGVKKCSNEQELQDALAVIFELDTKAIIEPYLESRQEINCSVLGSTDECQASVCEEPLSSEEILSFEDKYLKDNGGKKGGAKGMASLDRRIPAHIEKSLETRIKSLAQEVFKACGCSGVARIDFMIARGQSMTGEDVPNGRMIDKKTNEVYITEINTIPGSLSFYLWEASGISFRELIDKLVEITEFEYKKKKSLLRTYDSPILNKIVK